MRLVTHTCSNTEIVAALGRGGDIVGVDDHSDHPPELLAELPRIGPDQDIDVDRVRALEPDLVITSLTIPGHERCVERLEAAGLDLLVLEPTCLEHVPRDIRRIGEAIGAREEAEALAGRFEAAMAPAPVPAERPRILVEWWPRPVIAPAARSWVTAMIELAGGANPWGGRAEKSVPLESEQVLDAAPEAVVIAWCGVPFRRYRPDVVRRREGWKALPAVRDDRIFCVTEAWLGRPGPRLVHGLAALKEVVADCRGGPRGRRRFG